MQRSLFRKYFAICSSIILSSILVLGMLFITFASRYFEADKLKTIDRYAQYARALTAGAYESNNYILSLTILTVQSMYATFSSAFDATIFYVDSAGRTLLCAEKASNCVHAASVVPEGIMQQALRGRYAETGTLGSIYSQRHYTVGYPVLNGDSQAVGVVFVSSSANEMAAFRIEILNLFFVSSIAVLLLAFVIIYFVTSQMVRPLRTMVSATKAFSKGDFSVRVPVDRADEIGQLASAFNNMATALAELESMRRSFIANVSHELKTPMTTIGGFIDGILDGTIPEEKRNHYLTIVSEEVKRLSRLVRSMLNIARIEAGEMKTAPTVFDINDTVCHTLFNFEQRIESRNLDIQGLDVGKVMVEADPDLIHQVVYNLIDNAVKFVNEGGYIRFGYREENGMTVVSIRNSGEGLPPAELHRLFDRFYKTDKSRSLDKNGVGLGLYIVKTIINLHKGEIHAASVEGEYTEFAFSLPTAPAAKPGGKHHKSDEVVTVEEYRVLNGNDGPDSPDP